MPTGERGIREGPQEIAAGEEITWVLNVTAFGSASGAVSSPTMRIIKLSNEDDVSASCLSGAMSVSGQNVTLQTISSLEEGEQYRADVQFTKDSSRPIYEIEINCPARIGVG